MTVTQDEKENNNAIVSRISISSWILLIEKF